MVRDPSGLRQEDYIYGLEWDVNVVTLFAEVLADQARMGHFQPHGLNRHAIQTAQYMLSKFFNKSFELKECVEQVRLLRKRHSTFSNILMRDDVAWANENNELAYNDHTWKEIVALDPFAWAYCTYGDPHWEDLQAMFGPPTMGRTFTPNKVVDGRNIIVIEDDMKAPPLPKYTPLDEVIEISSDASGSLSSSFMKELEVGGNDSDDDGSYRSPSLKTESSSNNRTPNSKGKSTMFGDNICMSLYGASYVSSSTTASPNSKK